MVLPDLELIITRTSGGAATASLRVELPRRRADLAEDVPVTLHDEALRGLLHIPEAYAGAFTGMIFVPQLRAAWQRALGYAEGTGELLRVRLHLRGGLPAQSGRGAGPTRGRPQGKRDRRGAQAAQATRFGRDQNVWIAHAA